MTIPAAAESTAHPSDSALGAFLEGRLAGDELGELLDHLNECGPCLRVFGEASALAEEVERGERMERQP